jgi:glycerol-3-phosphate dehydrogenase
MAAERETMDGQNSRHGLPTRGHGPDPDDAVIGGGIADLWTAWELVSAWLDVVVLEADRIAAGVTGYTTAAIP